MEYGSEEKKVVSLVHCADYERDNVSAAVKRAVDLTGGIGAFVTPGQTVLVKPNLLMASEPETSVVTHPEVIYAVVRLLRDYGCRVIIADSPGGGMRYTARNLEKAYEKAGFASVARELGAELNTDPSDSTLTYHEGKAVKQFRIIKPATEADAIVMVSKAKTHTLTYYSGAVKNLFGVVPGLEKPLFHARFQDPERFSEMLLDLNGLMKPVLQVMDAVEGMEGNGPMSGSPRHIGAVLAGSDANALDVVVSQMIALDPHEIETIKCAINRGLLKGDFSDVEVCGDDPASVTVSDYRHPSTYRNKSRNTLINRRILAFFQKKGIVVAPRPVPDTERCTGCGNCVRVCPVDAITMKSRKVTFDLKKCIRCYCCHEMCDSAAIRLERNLIGRLVWGLLGD